MSNMTTESQVWVWVQEYEYEYKSMSTKVWVQVCVQVWIWVWAYKMSIMTTESPHHEKEKGNELFMWCNNTKILKVTRMTIKLWT